MFTWATLERVFGFFMALPGAGEADIVFVQTPLDVQARGGMDS